MSCAKASVTGSSNLVPDKTFKRYKAAQNHRFVPLKTFSRNKIPFLIRQEKVSRKERDEREAVSDVQVRVRGGMRGDVKAE